VTVRQIDLLAYGASSIGVLEMDTFDYTEVSSIDSASVSGLGIEAMDQAGIMDMSDLDLDRFQAAEALIGPLEIETLDVNQIVNVEIDGLEDFPQRSSSIEDIVIYG
jgi:hypothetical protein